MEIKKINIVELWNSDEKEIEKVEDEIWDKAFHHAKGVTRAIFVVNEHKYEVPFCDVACIRFVKNKYCGGMFLSVECYDSDHLGIDSAKINLLLTEEKFLHVVRENDAIKMYADYE